MLRNQDAVPEPQSSVSQARVTPDELTKALAAIEARKQAEASRLAGTIPIDQAISDLHLDSTSDEIWAEVQNQRAKTAAAPPEQPPTARVAGPQVGPFRVPQFSLPRHNPNLQASQVGRWLGVLPPILIGWVLIQANVIPHFWKSAPAAPPILRPLAQEPDGKEVYADDAALVQISEGKSPAQITISESSTGNRWPLIKQGNHVYLRGYIAATNSLHPLQGKSLNVYNDDNSGELDGSSTSEVTLRVD